MKRLGILLIACTLLVSCTTRSSPQVGLPDSELVSPSPLPREFVSEATVPPSWIRHTGNGYTLYTPRDWTDAMSAQLTQSTGFPALRVRPRNFTKPTESFYNFEIIVGPSEVYSSSGAVCSNQSCEVVALKQLTIDSIQSEFTIIEARRGDEEGVERYTFSIGLTNGATVTATYFDRAQEELIFTILQSIDFLQDRYSHVGGSIVEE